MTSEPIFSEGEIKNISALGGVLREIRARLKREGVDIDEARRNLSASRLKKSHAKRTRRQTT